MTARRICALALAASACSSQKVGQAFDLKTPVALVPFNGYTRYDSSLHLYVAVASMQGDELRVFDPLENKAVSSPGFAFALSVPTDPRPVLLASASLNDVDAGNNPVPGADLLVVASAGEQMLQVVDTWEGPDSSSGMHVLPDPIDLRPVADPGTEIRAMIGLPSFQPGTTQLVPGRARILMAFSRAAGSPTAKLVTVEFQRGADGTTIDTTSTNVAVHSVALGFEAVSLSRVAENTAVQGAPAAARYPSLVFAATPDIVTGTDGRSALGVAGLDVRDSDPALWTATAIGAGAPTDLVAAAVVGERYANTARALTKDPVVRAFGSAALRVYADLDPAACGPTQAIACGIATLDPLANPPGLVSEIIAAGAPGPVYVPNQSYRAPMALPGVSLAMAVAMPPRAGAERCDPPYDKCNDPSFLHQSDDGAPLMRLSPFSGQEWTTGALVVASSTGSSYVLDIGGSAAPDDVSLLNTSTSKVQATNGRALAPQGWVASDATPVLGLWDSQGTPTDTSIDTTIIDRSIQVTPGFTPDDDWTVTWQGTVPGFELRHAVVGRAGGNVYVAFQTPTSDGRWFGDTDLSDGSIGIHALDPGNPAQEPGDIVEVFDLYGTSRCQDGSGNPVRQDTPVLGFLAANPALPATDPASLPGGALELGPAVPACIDPGAADGQFYQALVSVRAFGLVLAGTRTGYAGRPTLDRNGPPGSTPISALKWQDERGLAATCSPANRLACEQLSIARKARRFYYPLEPPCPQDNLACYGSAVLADPLMPADPLVAGPALAFRVGPNPASASGAIARGLAIAFSTLSGVSPMSRAPSLGSVPNAAISVDRSLNLDGSLSSHADEGTWFYVSYTGNTVLGFGPGLYVGTAASLR